MAVYSHFINVNWIYPTNIFLWNEHMLSISSVIQAVAPTELGTGGTVSRRTANKKLTKLY